jgi:hypothetical protein
MKRACIAIALGLLSSASMAGTTTLSPGANITAAVEAANPGDIIQLNPGTYTPTNTGAFVFTGSFAIGKNVTIRGLGTTPAGVVLQSNGAPLSGYALHFMPYNTPTLAPSSNGARLENVTITNAPGGIEIADLNNVTGGRITDVTLKNVVISTLLSGGSFGVLVKNDDRVVLDNVTITSYQAGINLMGTNDSLVMNSTVTSSTAPNAPGLAVIGGSANVIVNNTIGTPKSNPTVDSGYSFPQGGVVFYNTTANRFDGNTVQGFRADGLDYTAIDGSGVTTAQSTDNYVGKNTVVSTGFAANLAGGSGIWSNCGSANTWLYGNDSSGAVEGGITVWDSNSNMVLGNTSHNHETVGVFVSGGTETAPFCTANSSAYAVKPNFNYVRSNVAVFNQAEQMIIRSADNNDISLNFMSPRASRTGGLQPPPSGAPAGQSGITFQTDAAYAASAGFRMAGNISSENERGVWNDDSKNNTGIEFFLNRVFGSTFNRMTVPSPLNIDAGSIIGGNFWSGFAASGNPSSSTPFNGVAHDSLNDVGRVTDRYPFQTEDMGRVNAVQVFEPIAGSIARGTRRTVRWYAPGCVYVDVNLDGATTIASDVPNTGYTVATIPGGTSLATHFVQVQCKNSAGTVVSAGNGPTFTVTDSTLQLVAPGRDDVYNAGAAIFVGWTMAASISSVNVMLSTDGGATFPTTLASGVTDTHARVTLPGGAAHQGAVIKVVSGSAADSIDGVFAIRGTSPGFTNVASGRKFVMGGVERLEWSSPVNSRLVTITANGTPIATNLPDRGYFDWVVKDFGAVGLTLAITYKDTLGVTTLGSASNALGVLRYQTTITFGAVSTIPAGSTQPITATTNSGLPVTLSSLTPSVCSVSGTTATAIANGTCTIAANQAGNATYAPAQQVTVNFMVASVSTRVTGISTRMQVLTADKVLIGGFVISGSTPKTVAVRARGPSLTSQGVTGALADPTMTIVPANGDPPMTNDDWGSDPNAAALSASGLAPTNPKESAMLVTLNPGAYTAVVQGVGGSTGVALVEVYEVDHPESPLTGISTRGQVQTADNVMIGGFIITGTTPQTVVVRAKGPSLTAQGVSGALQNPILQLVYASDGTTITNDDWGTAANASTLSSIGFAPTDPRESAILVTLPPGAYTAIVSGVGGTTGVALVEVYVP